MYCMRCGRELKEGQVFCKSCRELMDRYPVPPEEQIVRLRSTVRWLYLLLVVEVLAFAFTAAILLYRLNQQGRLIPW